MHLNITGIKVPITLAVILSVVGCTAYDKRKFVSLTATPAESRLGTAVFTFTPKCPSELTPQDQEEEAAIAAVLLGAVASFGAQFAINAISKIIDEYKEGLNGQFIAAGIGKKDSLDNNRCLIVTRALFGPTPANFKQRGDHLTKKLLERLGLMDYPAFYLEMRVQREDDNIVLKPLYLSYPISVARNKGSGRKRVAVALALSDNVLTGADNIKEEKAFSVFRHDFGKLEVGKSYSSNLLLGTEASQPKSAKHDQATFNIASLVTDSEEPHIALLALFEAFQTKKNDLQSAFEEALKKAIGANEEGK